MQLPSHLMANRCVGIFPKSHAHCFFVVASTSEFGASGAPVGESSLEVLSQRGEVTPLHQRRKKVHCRYWPTKNGIGQSLLFVLMLMHVLFFRALLLRVLFGVSRRVYVLCDVKSASLNRG